MNVNQESRSNIWYEIPEQINIEKLSTNLSELETLYKTKDGNSTEKIIKQRKTIAKEIAELKEEELIDLFSLKNPLILDFLNYIDADNTKKINFSLHSIKRPQNSIKKAGHREKLEYGILKSFNFDEEGILENLNNYENINHDELLNTLLENNKEVLVAKHLEKFKLEKLTHEDIAQKALRNKEPKYQYLKEEEHLLKYLNQFNINQEKFIFKAIELGYEKKILENIEFLNINHDKLVKKLFKTTNGYVIPKSLNKLKLNEITHQDIADELLQINNKNNYEPYRAYLEVDKIINNIDNFENIDYKKLVYRGIEVKFGNKILRDIVLKKPELFNNDDIKNIYTIITETNQKSILAEHFSLFENQNIEKIYETAIEGLIQSNFVTRDWDIFKLDHQIISKTILEKEGAQWLGKNIKIFNKISKEVKIAYEIFGEFMTNEGSKIIDNLIKGKIDPNIQDFIYTGGKEGIEQLRAYLSKFKQNILQEDFDHTILIKNPFLRTYYQSYIQYKGEQDVFLNKIKKHDKLKKQGKLIKLGEEFKPSENIYISKIDKKNRDNFQFTKDFLDIVNELKENLQEVYNLLNENKPFEILEKNIIEIKHSLVFEIENKLKENNKVEVIKNLKDKKQILENFKNLSKKNFEENLFNLSNFKEFNKDLRKYIFLISMKENINMKTDIENFLSTKEINLDNISWLHDFINHRTNQETISKYFKKNMNEKQYNKISEKLLYTKAIDETIFQIQNSDILSDKEINLKFIPSVDLPLEFSGYIGKTCWKDKYASIAKKFPNITAITFVKDEGTKNERLVGNCLLIKTKSKKGEPLLIIRGLNPTETFINSIDTNEFMAEFFKYCKDIAQKDNRKLGIVRSVTSAMASTNRPAIQSYLSQMINTKIMLKTHKGTKFNEYDITGSNNKNWTSYCYLP